MTRSKQVTPATRSMAEMMMTSSPATVVGTQSMAEKAMTRLMEIEELISSGGRREMIFCVDMGAAAALKMATAESKAVQEMTRSKGTGKETHLRADPAMIRSKATSITTNYLVTAEMTFCAEEHPPTISLVALALTSTTLKATSNHMSIPMRFINAMDIRFSTPRRLLSLPTRSKPEVH